MQTRFAYSNWTRWPRLGSLLGTVVLLFLNAASGYAQAPTRSSQPYAEATKCANANVIFCEDFNYPNNFYWSGGTGNDNSNWINAGLTRGVYGGIGGLQGRRINPATTYPTKPDGAKSSGSQPDHVWVANWDPTKGAQGNGSTWGQLRPPGGNYANGSAPAKDVYIRFQYYVTGNYAWPGDPRSDKYNYGASSPIDNKILFIYPPEGSQNPTGAAYDAGLLTSAATFDPIDNARYADALIVRVGNTSDNYKSFPLCNGCSSTPKHLEYGPFQHPLIFRNPHDVPIFGKIFRFDTNRWYTIEMRYKLSSADDRSDGTVEVWIDGTKVYSASDLQTCGSGNGDCSGIGEIDIVAWHNSADETVWNGQQVIDNLIISRSYIGPPGQTMTSDNMPPAPPTNLSIVSQ